MSELGAVRCKSYRSINDLMIMLERVGVDCVEGRAHWQVKAERCRLIVVVVVYGDDRFYTLCNHAFWQPFQQKTTRLAIHCSPHGDDHTPPNCAEFGWTLHRSLGPDIRGPCARSHNPDGQSWNTGAAKVLLSTFNILTFL